MEGDPVKREHPRPKSGFHRNIVCSVQCAFTNLEFRKSSQVSDRAAQEARGIKQIEQLLERLWHMCKIYISILSKSVLSAIRPQMSAFDNSTGLYWTVLSCTGLDCTQLHWTILNCTGLNWAVLGCKLLYCAVLGCI